MITSTGDSVLDLLNQNVMFDKISGVSDNGKRPCDMLFDASTFPLQNHEAKGNNRTVVLRLDLD